MVWQDKTKWVVTVSGFADQTIYTGHGDDLRDNNVADRYGELLLLTDKEEFTLIGKGIGSGDVCFMFPNGPVFIGNNPEMGVPTVEMRSGGDKDNRQIDKGVYSIFHKDGVKYTFHRPDPDDANYKLFYVTIEKE